MLSAVIVVPLLTESLTNRGPMLAVNVTLRGATGSGGVGTLTTLDEPLPTGVPPGRERERAASLIGALEASLEQRGAAVIQLDRFGNIEHASTAARELIEAYFGSVPTQLLPPVLAAWAHGKSEWEPLTIDGPGGRLRVLGFANGRAGPWRELILEEQRTSAPPLAALEGLGLTCREAQVLRLLVCGKRNEHIARQLCISEGTVRKHLEHIYRRLRVASRSEAIARVLG